MNFLILGHSTTGDNYGGGGFPFLKKIADSIEKKGSTVIAAFENRFNTEASFTSFQDKKVYYFSDWARNYSDSRYDDIDRDYSNETAYINYERLRCIGAGKSIRNFKTRMEDRLIKKLYFFFDEIVVKEKIDCIIFETVSTVFSRMAYHVSVDRNILYLGWISSRIPGRFDLLHDPFGDIEKRREALCHIKIEEIDPNESEKIKNYIDSVCEVQPDYMKNNPYAINKNYVGYYIGKITKLFKLLHIAAKLKDDLRGDYYCAHPLEQKYCYAKYRIARQMKVPRLKKYFDPVDLSEKYYLFPMHYQPEASTGVNAPCYCNQVDVIKNIAFSLPCGTKLYVKDHPCGIGFMSMKEYKQIFSLPNVRYIDPKADNKSLIAHSLGVVTITSTMGYEALLMKKPVLTLGKVFYNFHPYCMHISGYEELTSALQSFFEAEHTDFDDVNVRFVKVYRDSSYEGTLLSEKDGDIDKVTDAVLKAAQEKGDWI